MKISRVLAVLCVGVAACQAGDASWITDFEAAKKAAAEKKVPILADFSGSDWCGWCIKLDKEVFAKQEFKEFASSNVVLFIADFPRKSAQKPDVKAQNQKLSKEYNIEGFPTVLLLDATGKQLAKTGYRPGGAAVYVKHLQELIGKK